MAVTAPAPPTPPTPPVVPKVTLSGGGSVTETTKPQGHGPKSDEELHEQQAREAVSDGSGPLSRTTVNDGKEKDSKPGMEHPVKQETPARNDTPAGGQVRQETIQQGGQPQDFSGMADGQQGTQAKPEAVAKIPESPDYHGTIYWGGMLFAIAVFVAVLLRMVLLRRDVGKESQGRAGEAAMEPDVSPKAGMTAAEVLQEIEVRETRQRMAPMPQAAKEYAAQATAKPEAAGRPRQVRPVKKDGEERERFEVRI